MTWRRELALLVGKELRQMTRNRGAIFTSLFFPALMLVAIPAIQLVSVLSASSSPKAGPVIPSGTLPGLSGIPRVEDIFLLIVFPIFYVLAGLLTPSIGAIYTIVSEREQRTAELLMALPVTVREVLAAKLLANVLANAGTILPFFAVNAVLVVVAAHADGPYVASALVLLLCAVACSIGAGLFLGLVARDVRTANNLSGVLLAPAMVLVGVAVVSVPGLLRFYALGGALLVVAAALLAFCLRWLTVERYLN